MSTTVCVAPILSALCGTEDILGPDRQWRPQNAHQERIVKLLKLRNQLNVFFQKATEGGIDHKELRYWVDWVAENLNKILKEEGFDIQLEDFGPGEFGVVSILDVLVEWLTKGEEDEVFFGNVAYPAVRMNCFGEVDGEYTQLVEVLHSSVHPEPIGMIHTKTGDRVYMSVAGVDSPPEGFELYDNIKRVRAGIMHICDRWDGMLFPMVDLDDRPDISWLSGMNTVSESGDYAEISQALQQTKFKMNQYGARVKSAVAIEIVLSAARDEPEWLVIDEPFYLWIERDGVSFPVVGMYVDPSDWKNPGNLQDM